MIYKSLINKLKIIISTIFNTHKKYKECKSYMILRMIRILRLRRSLKDKQSVEKDVKKSNIIKISINCIICWKCNNKDAKNNVCIDIRTTNFLICVRIWFTLCHTHYLGLENNEKYLT